MRLSRIPIRFRRFPANPYRQALMASPDTRLKSREIPTTWITLSRLPAPMYWEHNMDVPREMTSKMINIRFRSWFTNPTAATLLSECLLSIKVSTAPNIMTRNVSMNIGNARETSCLLNDPYRILCRMEIERHNWSPSRDNTASVGPQKAAFVLMCRA